MSQSDSYDDFFAGAEVVHRDPAAGARFKQVGDFVLGEVVDVYKMPYTDINTGKVKLDDKGNELDQLVITVQTDHRNWDVVNNVPKRKDDQGNKVEIPASEDTGRRNVFVQPFKNLFYRIADATAEATGKPSAPVVGGKIQVKFADTKDTGKPQPAKQFEVFYKAPEVSSVGNPFAGVETAPAAPAPAPAQQAAPAAPAPAPAAPAAPADPWASTTPVAATTDPPF